MGWQEKESEKNLPLQKVTSCQDPNPEVKIYLAEKSYPVLRSLIEIT